MWLGFSSWLEQTCKQYCTPSVYDTLYHYFGWRQFQSLPSRCFQEFSQYFLTPLSGNYSALFIGTGAVLITAASLYYARNHAQTNDMYGIKIEMKHSRGFHDSTMDFPVKDSPKYDVVSSSVIVLDFGHKIFTLPRNFMHYIDDAESLGWSWVPPKEFLDCINQGYRQPEPLQEITSHDIGFLVSSIRFNLHNANSKAIYDSHGTDSNVREGKATKVEIKNKVAVDAVTLKRLKNIMQYIDAKEKVEFSKGRALKISMS
jgi:hypothetical protein